MKTTRQATLRPDLIISAVMLFIFGGAIVLSLGWPDQVAMLPRLAAVIGAAASLFFVIRLVIGIVRGRAEAATSAAILDGEPDEHEEDAEYVFATVGGKAWARALAWIAGFFVLLALFGIFIASGVFALIYLRASGKKSWLFSASYAIVLTAALWALMRWLTYIPSPTGLILPGW